MKRLERVSRAAKAAICFVLYCFGVLRLWQLVTLRKRAVVLMYHRVLTKAERDRSGSHPGIVVDSEAFAKHVKLLKRRFVVLSPDEFAKHMERKIPFPSSSCLVTFDDGWRDNRTNALPVLQQYGCPALVFLPVNYIGRQRLFWRESLTHLLVRAVLEVRRTPSHEPKFRGLLEPFGLERLLGLRESDPRFRIIERVFQSSLLPSAAEQLVQALLTTCEGGGEDISANDRFLDWEDVEAMVGAGITFGGHGAEHRRLTDLSPEEARLEIAAAKEGITKRFPNMVATFSYPNGCLTPEIAATVGELGYRLAFTTRAGFVRCDDDRFTLRRVNIHQGMTDTVPMFLARILGLW